MQLLLIAILLLSGGDANEFFEDAKDIATELGRNQTDDIMRVLNDAQRISEIFRALQFLTENNQPKEIFTPCENAENGGNISLKHCLAPIENIADSEIFTAIYDYFTADVGAF